MLLCLKLTMELEHVNWDHMEICLDIQNEWYATQSNIVVSFAIRTDDFLYIFLCWPQFNSQHQSSSTIFICNVSMLAEPHTCARLLSQHTRRWWIAEYFIRMAQTSHELPYKMQMHTKSIFHFGMCNWIRRGLHVLKWSVHNTQRM